MFRAIKIRIETDYVKAMMLSGCILIGVIEVKPELRGRTRNQ